MKPTKRQKPVPAADSWVYNLDREKVKPLQGNSPVSVLSNKYAVVLFLGLGAYSSSCEKRRRLKEGVLRIVVCFSVCFCVVCVVR